jgi:hypothetical protein
MVISEILNSQDFFSDINFIPAQIFSSVSLTFLCGTIFLFLVFFSSRDQKLRSFFGADYFLKLSLLFWLPLFIFFSLNGVSATVKNFNFFRIANLEKRSFVQISDLSRNQLYGAQDFFFFLDNVKESVPKGSNIYFFSGSAFSPYLKYYSIPYFNLTEADKADYFIFYFFLPQEKIDDAVMAEKILGFDRVFVYDNFRFVVKNNNKK